ncbi:hypothetical protein MD484_g6126, partial [Candolleomyces efflorescens]
MSSRSATSSNDFVAHSPESPSSDSPSETAEEKPSHDASVFVGSLPSNVDQAELTKLLSEHLSEYAEIKNIKVVRDTKGGICAFVQCESADAASDLIQNLQSQKPKPFMGRILRFEPARAFRTLLISYRILYNHEAVQAGTNTGQDTLEAEDGGVFLQPLNFDEQTIQIIASYFGRVEKISPFSVAAGQCDVEAPWKSYPAPHNSPRSPSMNQGCWEVKWDFRDDCVSALMALRRVPHMSVTWAHQPSNSGWECRYPNYVQFPQTISTPYIFPPHQAAHILPTSPGFSHSSSTPSHASLRRAPPDYEGSDKNPFPDMARVADNGHFYPAIPSSAIGDGTVVHQSGSSESHNQRSIDPFSLFVGGLEALGPSAWNEEKVRQHFAKYGGLQSVKFVTPFSGTTGFAFLKFDNTDGPARAVLEEVRYCHSAYCMGKLTR